jgi:hypothetical protein
MYVNDNYEASKGQKQSIAGERLYLGWWIDWMTRVGGRIRLRCQGLRPAPLSSLTEVSADASFNSMNGTLSIAAVTDLAISHFLEQGVPCTRLPADIRI